MRVPLAAAAALCYCPRIPQVCVAADGIQRIPLTFPGIFQAYSTGVRRRRRNTLYSEYILGVFQAYSTGVRSRCRNMLYPLVYSRCILCIFHRRVIPQLDAHIFHTIFQVYSGYIPQVGVARRHSRRNMLYSCVVLPVYSMHIPAVFCFANGI